MTYCNKAILRSCMKKMKQVQFSEPIDFITIPSRFDMAREAYKEALIAKFKDTNKRPRDVEEENDQPPKRGRWK